MDSAKQEAIWRPLMAATALIPWSKGKATMHCFLSECRGGELLLWKMATDLLLD